MDDELLHRKGINVNTVGKIAGLVILQKHTLWHISQPKNHIAVGNRKKIVNGSTIAMTMVKAENMTIRLVFIGIYLLFW